jgi:hypothetical protein
MTQTLYAHMNKRNKKITCLQTVCLKLPTKCPTITFLIKNKVDNEAFKVNTSFAKLNFYVVESE